MALQLWKSLGLLNNSLPFKAILYLFCPLHKLHLLQIIPDIIIPSRLGPYSWFSFEWFPFVYSFHYASFGHSICVSKPTQLLGFNIIYYVPCLINSSNSLFVLILHILLASLVGPNIFCNIFLSNTENFCIILSLRTYVSQP